MTAIGIRELREDMRTIIGRVMDGDSFTLTDHRHPVAQLIPITHNDRYSITLYDGVTALYCTPCGAIIGNCLGPVTGTLQTIASHNTIAHPGDDQ